MRLSLLPLLAACATQAPADLPLHAAPPPMWVQVPDAYAGYPASITVQGANPGDLVYLVASRQRGSGPCPAPLNGPCLSVQAPLLRVGATTADAAGTASFTFQVPPGAAGSVVHFQAAAPGRPGITSSVSSVEVYDGACPATLEAFWDETFAVRACNVAADCGQVMQGTSCGCTRDWVARQNVDLTDFYALLQDAGTCGYGAISTCDCPQTNGFACIDGTCAWNYVP
jgi:hypothetical protein